MVAIVIEAKFVIGVAVATAIVGSDPVAALGLARFEGCCLHLVRRD